MKKRITKILLLLVLYLAGGALLPFLFQPKPDEAVRSAFHAENFYSQGEACVDRVGIVETNQEALDIRLSMIEEARERIVLSTFDIRPGGSCTDIFSALYAAANRGVQVQIYVDGLYGAIHMKRDPMFYAVGSLPNVEIRFYNIPNPFLPWTINGRMHDKYLMIDDRWLLLGGRNTFDYFLGTYTDKNVSHDREVLIHNTAAGTGESKKSVISAVADYFSSIWNQKESRSVYESVPKNQKGVEQAAADLGKHYEKMRAERPEIYGVSLGSVDPTIPVEKVTFISNPTHIYAKEPLVWYQLTELMKQAHERVYIQTPYAVFGKDMYQTFSEIGAGGIPFDMQVNSIAVGDNFMASSDYKLHRKDIQRTGVRLYEYQGEDSSHGKSGLIDRDLSFVGSYNLDMRSTYVDTETVLVIHGEEFNRQLEACIMAMHEESLLVNDDGSYEPESGVAARELPAGKKLLFSITSVIFQLFRYVI